MSNEDQFNASDRQSRDLHCFVQCTVKLTSPLINSIECSFNDHLHQLELTKYMCVRGADFKF